MSARRNRRENRGRAPAISRHRGTPPASAASLDHRHRAVNCKKPELVELGLPGQYVVYEPPANPIVSPPHIAKLPLGQDRVRGERRGLARSCFRRIASRSATKYDMSANLASRTATCTPSRRLLVAPRTHPSGRVPSRPAILALGYAFARPQATARGPGLAHRARRPRRSIAPS